MNPQDQKQQNIPLPPPLFANQRSNLSALASSMGSFSADLMSRNDKQQTKEYHSQQAQAFLNQQHSRISKIEQDLLKATEDLLPMDSKCMTVTELLGVCRELQETNVELMKQLDSNMSLNEYYTSVLSEEQCQACMVEKDKKEPSLYAAAIPTTPWQVSLEQVVETDNETDATTTPGSSMFFSPPLSLSSQAGGGTPVTPSLDNLHLSSNTAAVLQETPHQQENEDVASRHSLDAIETWRARKYSFTFGTKVDEDTVTRDETLESSVVDSVLVQTSAAGKQQVTTSDNVQSARETRNATLSQPPNEYSNKTKVTGEAISKTRSQDDNVSVASSSSTTTTTSGGDERPMDSSTIVGCGDLTFLDDDTAVATIATVLGRGRQGQVKIPNIPEEDELKMRVSLDVGTKSHVVAGSVREASHSTSKRSPPLTQAPTADTTIVGMNETLLDDETVAEVDRTVIGQERRRTKATSLSPKPEQPSDEISTDTVLPLSPGEHTVKEIMIDTSNTSCSMDGHQHANTDASDVSVLDSSSTLASPRSIAAKNTEDETTVGSLLVTPVLDRYRLEADDTSIGVKVVPNERRTHHEVPKQKQRNLLTKYGGAVASQPPEMQPIVPHPKTPKANEVDTFSKSSPFVTQRSRTIYRKTPYPKKAGSSSQIADENARPNMDARVTLKSDRHSTKTLKTRRESLSSPFTRISLPELTQRSSLPSTAPARRLPFSATKPRSDRRHTISFKQQQPTSMTPLTAAWIAKHMPEEQSNLGLDSLDVSDTDSSFTFH